ncbi:RagB/SusD family nutrient uptake outer membrane protein [Pedobacter nyackensis]|uniref:RagB/SusD family nutrient uptake outer membrane protein n=1 Tax=Pedobacter nyackensis TaxID=475255 RepID=UPI0029301065|nr:RagB/SusD family nutrient uptake outer membrane protein [Pedobacter nyackensis]
MNQKIKKYIMLLMAAATFTSCKRWLDVKPEDKFIESQLYSNAQGFADANNGFYINNGLDRLYGATLTCTTMDVLAQLYAVSSQNTTNYQMSTFSYGEKEAKEHIDRIWTDMYANIANTNKLLTSLDTYPNVLDAGTAARYRGETLGLRAMYYFDLMRMFTRPYATDSLSKILPYYDKLTHEPSEYMPTNYVMKKILDDLKAAEALLQNSDPAVNQPRVSKVTMTVGRNSRNYQMNYYAVKALQARVNLWRGDKATALAAAKALIGQQGKFPWTTDTDLNGLPSNKIFATEMILGVENTKLNDVFTNNFSPVLFDAQILAPINSGAFTNNTVFESNPGDYRNQYVWKIAGKPFPTFFKYMNEASISYNSNNTIPLIKMSEMYLIAAECEPDVATGLEYLNTLRIKRGIPGLPAGINAPALATAIMKEYRKEVFGEGQLFFYYKRTRASSVVSGATNTDKAITPENYTFPVPLSETTPR